MKIHSIRGSNAQRGYILLLVLVALVAMMLSGIALIRSMDTSQLIAGNLAARNATLHSADAGMQSAVAGLQAIGVAGTLNTDSPQSGYFAEEGEPTWNASSFWSGLGCGTCTIGPDAAGNTVWWVIHRMCTLAGNPNGGGNYCLTLNGSTATNNSKAQDAATFTGTAIFYYRITVRVVDGRNNSTLSQAFVTM